MSKDAFKISYNPCNASHANMRKINDIFPIYLAVTLCYNIVPPVHPSTVGLI
jgi:hypothetical protein